MREVLEGHVAAAAAAKLTDGECERLMELALELRAEVPNNRAQTLDADFHGMIIRGAGDEVIASLLSAIRRRGQDYRIFEMAHGHELKEISDEAHVQIARAIAERDPSRRVSSRCST
nr:FCD domain-containing protein [Tessaracoccus coleopterorum]